MASNMNTHTTKTLPVTTYIQPRRPGITSRECFVLKGSNTHRLRLLLDALGNPLLQSEATVIQNLEILPQPLHPV